MGWGARFREHERRVFIVLNSKYRSPLLDRIMKLSTHVGGASFCVILLLVLTLVFSFPVSGLLALITSHLIIQILKRNFRRRRPYVVEASIYFIAKPLKDASFPSGHTTAIFATCVSIALVLPWLSLPLMVVACFVGWSRIYLGLHYPIDVLVGALIGGLTAVICQLMI